MKGQKDKRRVTARGHFLDLVHKQHPKHYPAPWAYYKTEKNPKKEEVKQLSTKDKQKFTKMSFVDEIYRDNRKTEYPRPAPGAYDVRQTEKQYKEELERFKTRKVHLSEKMHAHTNDEHHGCNVPGPGSFNPKMVTD